MKKILSFIVLSILAVGLIGPLAVSAQATPPDSCVVRIAVKNLGATDNKCLTVGGIISQGDEGFGMCCFVQTVDRITSWVFYVMTAIAVLLFVYGGITYMIALGDPEKASKGGRIIIYAIIGLIIALVAKIVPNIVTTLVK
jgi:hypothetical protein